MRDKLHKPEHHRTRQSDHRTQHPAARIRCRDHRPQQLARSFHQPAPFCLPSKPHRLLHRRFHSKHRRRRSRSNTDCRHHKSHLQKTYPYKHRRSLHNGTRLRMKRQLCNSTDTLHRHRYTRRSLEPNPEQSHMFHYHHSCVRQRGRRQYMSPARTLYPWRKAHNHHFRRHHLNHNWQYHHHDIRYRDHSRPRRYDTDHSTHLSLPDCMRGIRLRKHSRNTPHQHTDPNSTEYHRHKTHRENSNQCKQSLRFDSGILMRSPHYHRSLRGKRSLRMCRVHTTGDLWVQNTFLPHHTDWR